MGEGRGRALYVLWRARAQLQRRRLPTLQLGAAEAVHAAAERGWGSPDR